MTQSAAMTASWHPAMRADWLVLRRTGSTAFVRIVGVPALLLTCCAGAACGDLYDGYRWCLAAGALLALGGSYAIAHKRLLDVAERWRFGWCGALPIAPGATAVTLLLSTAAALAASLAFITALLLGVSLFATHRGDLAYALAGIDLALVVGTVVAVARVFRPGAAARAHHAAGIREPLFALPWVDDARLPHLLDWQRRAALVRWRSGGNFILVGLVLAGVPRGPVLHEVVGLVLLALSLTWMAVTMGACADSTLDATRLLAATPFDPHRVRRAALRYPAIGACGAAVLAAIGVALAHPSIALWCGWAACAGAATAWPLRRLLVATRGRASPQ